MVTYASISHLVIISIDRYIAIKYPLRYQEIVTERRIIFTIVLAWGFTLLVTINELVLALIDSESIYSIYMHVNTIIQIVIGTLFIVVISLSYGYIYSETRRQVKRLLNEQLPQEEIQRIKKDRKAVTTLAFILITLGLTYLPAIIIGILTTSPGNIVGPPRVQRITWIWVELSIMFGSLCNPIIYCWRMENLRRAFLEILHLSQTKNIKPGIEMREIQRHQPGPSKNQAFSLPAN